MISRVTNRRMGYNFPMSLTTDQAATILGVQPRMVRLLIKQEKLRAKKHGRDWIIEEADLELVKERNKVGRPRKQPGEPDEHYP